MVTRLVAGGTIAIGVSFMLASRFVRRHCNYLATTILFATMVGMCYTLILRSDTDFSPFYMYVKMGGNGRGERARGEGEETRGKRY